MSKWKIFLLIGGLTIVGVGILFSLFQIILVGYYVEWTGFGEYISTSPNVERSKTLWDWMELLIIPLVLAIGAFFLNRSEQSLERQAAKNRAELEREIVKDRQQEAALQAYLDRMSDLLLKEKLLTTDKEEVHDLARTWTLTVLQGLDKERKGQVLKFLFDANLIKNINTIIPLKGADLSGADLSDTNLSDINLNSVNLSGANLHNVNLRYGILNDAKLGNVDLSNGDLRDADLSGAILSNAKVTHTLLNVANMSNIDLVGANLNNAHLTGANLSNANLSNADLRNADLRSANLSNANLSHANLIDAQLNGVRLTGANFTQTIMTSDDYHQIYGFSATSNAKILYDKKEIDKARHKQI